MLNLADYRLLLTLLVVLVTPLAAGQEPTPAALPTPAESLPRIPTSYDELLPSSPKASSPKASEPQAPAGSPQLAGPVMPSRLVEETEIIAPAEPSTTVEAGPATAADDAAEVVVAEQPATAPWYTPARWFGPAPWDSGIEFGLNGSSGTSESLSFRSGGFVKRKQKDYKFNGSLYYNKTHSNGVEVQSNALLDLRYDWLFDDSPWTLFVMSQSFYDEFQAFDFNFNANTGFGYEWFDKDWTQLTTSVGTGTSREFGGPIEDKWVAEASFGLNYDIKWNDNKKFYAKVDWFPEWDDFNSYRVLADVGFEFELHEPSNMSLKLGATDRYDSRPQGAQSHNLNYSALLIWKL